MPKIEQKQLVINELKEKIEKASSMVLVDARGLTVAEDTELRKGLREKNVDYKVYKNTMINFAIQGTPYDELAKHLEGPRAVGISREAPPPAAVAVDAFVTEFEKRGVNAGIVEGVYYDANTIVKIAKIPSREVLLSKLLGSFKSPMASFARVINEVLKSKGGESAAASDAE